MNTPEAITTCVSIICVTAIYIALFYFGTK